MRDFIELQYDCKVISWNEPEDDIGGVVFSAVIAGRFIQAESLALLISSLQDHTHLPLILKAA